MKGTVAVKGRVYILMFWCFQFVCLHFNFQIKRVVYANILRGCSKTSFIIKKNIRASKKIQGYYKLYRFIHFSHYNQNFAMAFNHGSNFCTYQLIPISNGSNIKRIWGTYSSLHPWYFRSSCLCNMPAKKHLDFVFVEYRFDMKFQGRRINFNV